MADIYRATDADLGRSVAIKVLAEHCAEDDDIRQRFLREALAAARLSGDPHTVTIYDVGESDGRPYLVMEYLPGGSLDARLAAGPVDRAQAMEWLEQAARALDAAHARGVVLRDVKPGNLLLVMDGIVCVADFGIARAAGVDSNTQTGVILGTVGYLAPEQAAGGRATAASDRYALAVVAHALLTGARPGPAVSSKPPPAAQLPGLRPGAGRGARSTATRRAASSSRPSRPPSHPSLQPPRLSSRVHRRSRRAHAGARDRARGRRARLRAHRRVRRRELRQGATDRRPDGDGFHAHDVRRARRHTGAAGRRDSRSRERTARATASTKGERRRRKKG